MSTFTTPKGTVLPFLKLKGKDYLQVAHRIVWFREEHPDWNIEPTIITFNNDIAVFKAEIMDQTGRVLASAHKTQAAKLFPGAYLEKCESGAIGRALAFLGYGTAHAQELEESGDTPPEALADTPLEKPEPTDRATLPTKAAKLQMVGAIESGAKEPAKAPVKRTPPPLPKDMSKGTCEHEWLKSKFPNKVTGEPQEYCKTCKITRPFL